MISCIGFWAMNSSTSMSSSARWAVFGGLILLSCVEKPCSVLNLVAVERDWVSTQHHCVFNAARGRANTEFVTGRGDSRR